MLSSDRARWCWRAAVLTSFLLARSQPAGATCANAQFAAHQLGLFFAGCEDAIPVSGYMFVASNPSVNSVGNDFVCEGFGAQTSQFIDCQPEAGVPGDGNITLQYDFGGLGASPGCPNPSGLQGVGRIFVHTVTPSGGSIIVSVGYSIDFAAYLIDGAHPIDFSTLSCGGPERRFIVINGTSLQNGLLHVDLTLSPPPVTSDCDPGTIAVDGGLDSCTAPLPPRTAGRIYTRTASCNASGGDLRLPSWTFASDVDAQGHASFDLTSSIADPNVCILVGATYRLGGQEVPAVAGFVKIPTDSFCADEDGDTWTVCQGDCNDSNAQVHPGAAEVCNLVDDDCDGVADENLGQTTCGIGACGRTVFNCILGVPQTCVPGAPSAEVCDGIDNDCDGATDEGDDDHDGFAVCSDCNDQNPAVHPGAAEICNGVDDDCNQKVDDFGGSTDGDQDGVLGACDNCPLVSNPSQADSDHDGRGNSCDNCQFIANPGQADADQDQRGDVCDNCPGEYNSFQDDSDADGRGDVCDNCPFAANPDQGNVDHDTEGDVCDLNDGLILLTVPDDFFVEWQQESGFPAFNVYRGDLAVLRQTGQYTQDPETVPLAAKACAVTDAYMLDGVGLSPGQTVFYLVTGNGPAGESSLGTNSAGAQRPNSHPCP